VLEATEKEVRAWYAYDWANSPFYQVLDPVFKVLLKRMAEMADAEGTYWAWPSAGSYPALVLWVTAGVQVFALLCLSAYADYGNGKLAVMRRLTWAGSLACVSCIFFFDSSLWAVAGGMRIILGIFFISSLTYYDSFLPQLAHYHFGVAGLQGKERADKEAKVTDQMSNMGQLIGYLGGLCASVLCMVIQIIFACDTAKQTCSEFNRLFFLSLSCSVVGVWWCAFSHYSFRHLKSRPGGPFPEGSSNPPKLGWIQARNGLLILYRKKQCGMMMAAFFVYSDALNTMLNLSVLLLEESISTWDVATFGNFMLAAFGGFLGVFLWSALQWKLGVSSKSALIVQVGMFAPIAVGCAFGMTDSTAGFYAAMTPLILTMGSMQANSRSVFAQVIPVGQEATMFSMWVIMDKGSSLVGTLVVVFVHTAMGNYYLSFWYCALAFTVGSLLLYLVDVERGQVDAGRRRPAETLQKTAEPVV